MYDIATQIGDAIGKLNDGGLIHGDLTTSNMLFRNGYNQLVLIDLGLSFTSPFLKIKLLTCMYSRELYSHCTLLVKCDGSDTSCIQEIIKAMVFHIEQACSSTTKRWQAYHGWMSVSFLQHNDLVPFSIP
ncbi:hypothetical protein NE237_014548 [Protea cynaroides]|uniref:non-specific serine/threonine protein kinase n=1 Tax=Protea cynaroides TaxID=273540 RepID=A0A9Q0KCA8_9MAGN|nr:hypothetical protein NE237_014548 [Protea cynaroides]